jgi:hypothetical protein
MMLSFPVLSKTLGVIQGWLSTFAVSNNLIEYSSALPPIPAIHLCSIISVNTHLYTRKEMTNRFTPRTLLVPYMKDSVGVDVGFGGVAVDVGDEVKIEEEWLAVVLTPTLVLVGGWRTTWFSCG